MARKKPTPAPAEPNSYTRAYNHDDLGHPTNKVPLDKPKNVRTPTEAEGSYEKMVQRRDQTRAKDYASNRTGRKFDSPGYGQVDLDAPGWSTDATPVLGRMTSRTYRPNIASGPAINEPHTTSPNQVVGRRMKDLSSAEQNKAHQVMGRYGVSVDSASREIKNANDRADMRTTIASYSDSVAASDKAFGPSGMASMRGNHGQQFDTIETPPRLPAGTGFYGGPSGPADKFSEVADEARPRARDKEHAAAVAAVALGDTSPKNKFEQNYTDGRPTTHPNAEAAKVAARYATAGVTPTKDQVQRDYEAGKGAGGYASGIGISGNVIKAVVHAKDMLDNGKSLRDVMPWGGKEKTAAFASALVHPSTADSYRVTDVLSGQSMAPHLDYQKEHKFDIVDRSTGETAGSHMYRAEDVTNGAPDKKIARKRLAEGGFTNHDYRRAVNKDGRPIWGNAPAEEMVAKGGGTVHAAADLAGRKAAVASGLVPDVNHAQAQHSMQEVDWRERQINRPDMTEYTPEGEYPGTSRLQDSADHFDLLAVNRRAQMSHANRGQQFR